jgi:hypothetical protein
MLELFYIHGWMVYHKEPGMAVWLCPWMDRISQGAKDGNANISMAGILQAARKQNDD